MTKTLDFSIGQEPRVLVKFEGWPSERRNLFMGQIANLDGVSTVAPAGGGTSAYVYYDGVSEADLEAAINDLAAELKPQS